MSSVIKGIVLSIRGDGCRVAPVDNVSEVSPLIAIPSHLRDLEKDDNVAYTLFSDGTGIIIGKI